MAIDGKSSSNQKRFCKTCGCYRLAVSKKKIVDFRVVGETLSCPFCGSNLDEAPLEKPKSALDGLFCDSSKPSHKQISSIFDASKDQSSPLKPEISQNSQKATSPQGILFLDSDKEAHFCRDCEFFMYHPYKSYCCKHDKDVSPSDDCSGFSRRKPGSN